MKSKVLTIAGLIIVVIGAMMGDDKKAGICFSLLAIGCISIIIGTSKEKQNENS